MDDSTLDEATALATWGGRGAVQLLAAKPDEGVMLLERLDATRSLEDIGIEEAIRVAGGLLRRLAIPAPPGIRTLATWADAYCQSAEARWERFGRPFARQLLEQTTAFAGANGPHSANLLVNHDLHYANVLAGAREPWLVIDPKIIAGDPEYGIAQMLWRRSDEIDAHGGLDRQFAAIVEAAELDEELARRWTLVRTVDYWLWGLSVGLTEDPARCKVIVDWLM
jgi:streptomycin 6-kinase